MAASPRLVPPAVVTVAAGSARQVLLHRRRRGRVRPTEVVRDPDWDASGLGRFARVHDPEGDPVELWEPPDAS